MIKITRTLHVVNQFPVLHLSMYNWGEHIFQKPRSQKGDKNQVPYSGSTNIR